VEPQNFGELKAMSTFSYECDFMMGGKGRYKEDERKRGDSEL